MKIPAFLTILLLVLISSQLLAQEKESPNIKRGDNYFYNFRYLDALGEYEKALIDDSLNQELNLKVAESYRFLNNPLEAEKYYYVAISENENIPSEYKLHFAQALSSNGKYKEAKYWFLAYQQEVSNDQRGQKNLKSIEELPKFFKDSLLYRVESVKINSKDSDFGSAFYENGIVFTSSRQNPGSKKRKYSADNSLFLDLYYSEEDEDGNLSDPIPFHKNVNSKYHEGPLVFYNGYSNMIFTRNSYHEGKEKLSEEDVNHLMLFSSSKIIGTEEWSKPVLLKLNDPEFSTAHPALSEDHQTLFFSSNREGGLGGADIYMASKLSDGSWGDPSNLGSVVNSEGSELFPFVSNGLLYFASNGHGGLGGLDIFMIPLKEVYKPNSQFLKNLGHPINSSRDDFGLIVKDNGKEGFFSSNRESGLGDDDIYRLKILHEVLKIIVVDADNGLELPNAKISLFQDSLLMSNNTSNSQGGVIEWVNPHKNYHIEVDYEGYESQTKEITSNQLLDVDSLLITLALDKKTRQFTDTKNNYDDNEITASQEDKATQSDLENLSAILENGVFLITESKDNILDSYILKEGLTSFKVTEDGLHVWNSGNYHPAIAAQNKSAESDIIRFYKYLDKYSNNPNMETMQSIYFGFDKYEISPGEFHKLDNIAKILKKYNFFSVTLQSHTDVRGAREYNEELSRKRAQSIKDYLVNRGVKPEKLAIDYKGEDMPSAQCIDEKCSDEIHKQNRRTDFRIVPLDTNN